MDTKNSVENWLDALPLDIKSINLPRLGFIKKFPNLNRFTNLKYLECSNSQEIDTINNLPDSLQVLVCTDHNLLNKIDFPPNLLYFKCNNNYKLKTINNLPQTLLYLDCSFCNLKEINNLPKSLIYLDYQHNDLKKINNYPESLLFLNCSRCDINELNNLPIKLLFLICCGNNIETLDHLPNEIIYLNCEDNDVHLKNLPNNLKILLGDIFYNLKDFNNLMICESSFEFDKQKLSKISKLFIWYDNIIMINPDIIPENNEHYKYLKQCLIGTKKEYFLKFFDIIHDYVIPSLNILEVLLKIKKLLL